MFELRAVAIFWRYIFAVGLLLLLVVCGVYMHLSAQRPIHQSVPRGPLPLHLHLPHLSWLGPPSPIPPFTLPN